MPSAPQRVQTSERRICRNARAAEDADEECLPHGEAAEGERDEQDEDAVSTAPVPLLTFNVPHVLGVLYTVPGYVVPSNLSPTQGRPVGSVRAPLLFIAAYAFLLAAWIFANPPFAAPDEWAHYLRAVSIGQGELIGEPAGAESMVGATRPPWLSEATYRAELEWASQNTRQVDIPAGLTPGWFRCPQTDPLVSAKCIDQSPPVVEATSQIIPNGTYQLLPYLVPALVSRLPTDPDDLSRLMRIAKALTCLIMLGASVIMLWRPGAGLLPLVGLLVAITPMAVFLASSLNPSGLEIASAIAFFAALLRLARESEPPPWTWIALGGSGAVLALSRSPAPFWIVLDLAVFLALVGPGRAWVLVRQQRRWSLPALGIVLVAVALNRLWERLYGPDLVFDPTPLRVSVVEGWRQLPQVLLEQVGVFNHLEFGMPSLAYTAWNALAVGLIAIALVVGGRRERIVLAASVAGALALPILLVATTMRHTGFGLQGRYVLAFSVVIPLLAGEVLVRRRDRLRALKAERLFLPFAIGAAAVQLVGWWANAHRFAVGRGGPRWFLDQAEWSPPAGWWPWFIVVTAGALLLVAIEPLDRFSRLSRDADELDRATATTRVSC